MPNQKLAAAFLAEWRAVEHRLAAIDALTAEAAELKLESQRLRTEYERQIAAAIEQHRPEPPPFPGIEPASLAAPANVPPDLMATRPGPEFCDGCREWIDTNEPIVATRATTRAGTEHMPGPVWIYHSDCLPQEDGTWRTVYRGLLTAVLVVIAMSLRSSG